MAFAEAEQTALDLWQPIAGMTSPQTSLIGWSYYEAGSKVASSGTSYAPSTHVGTHLAYDQANAAPQQLEVCILAVAPCGKNSRGKQVYLRKWIHNVLADKTDPNTHCALLNATNLLDAWNQGSGPHKLVPCDPTGGATGGPWAIQTHLYTHQLRRGPKRRKVQASSGTLSELVKDALALKSLFPDVPAAG